MSNGRISPRKAIQSWLQGTQTSTKGKDKDLQDNTISLSDQIRNKNNKKYVENHDGKFNAKPGNPTSLAKRLGLHAPFSALPEVNDAIIHDDAQSHRPCKTRRLDFSSDSFIKEAHHLVPKATLKRATSLTTMDDFKCPSAKRLASTSYKQYERRKRHKTRKDKYDLKVPKRRISEQQKDGTTPSEQIKPQYRRKRKATNIPIHEYSAANVAQGRLTVSDHHLARLHAQ